MTKQITPQNANTRIVDNQGRPTIEFFNFISQVAALEIVSGTLDPNGAVTAKQKTLYWNTTANTLWFKTSGPRLDTGWLQVSGM